MPLPCSCRRRPPRRASTPSPPAPPSGGGTSRPAPKVTISFKGTAKTFKLSRKGTFVLRFKATPGLKGTYSTTGVKQKGAFKADGKGNVKLTIKAGKLRKRSVKVKITAVSGTVRATHTFTVRRP